MENKYNRHNRRKYNLKIHIVLVTKYRKQLLTGSIVDDVERKFYDICAFRGYDIRAMEADKDHIHCLISYNAVDRVCDIVKVIQQEITYTYGKNIRTYCPNNIEKRKPFGQTVFVCSIGEVSSVTIQKYIENQG